MIQNYIQHQLIEGLTPLEAAKKATELFKFTSFEASFKIANELYYN